MKIYKLSQTEIKEFNPQDTGALAYDMMNTRMEREMDRNNWKTGRIPYLIESANAIYRELSKKDNYVHKPYINQKLDIIENWINNNINNNLHPDDSLEKAEQLDPKAIQNTQNAISQLDSNTSQKIAIIRIMQAILIGDFKTIIANINYLKRWLKSVHDKAIQNENQEPIY